MQQYSAQALGGPSLDEAGLCLLSLDGGGVRGLSTLLILKRLMDRTNTFRKELGLNPVKPWEVFDLIGGTSTGGLIAIMLGRLKMDVSECIDSYTSMFGRIFEKQKHKYPVNLWENWGNLQNKFDSHILRESIRKIVEDRSLSETELFNSAEERSCRVFVCATDFEVSTHVCIRDYNLVDESNADSATIVEAALATSAATTFFEPVTIGARRYVDGALGRNNPIRSVWAEAQNVWCPEDGRLEPMVKCFVSIGTGNPGLSSVGESVKGFLRTLKDIATETENTAAQSLSQHRGLLDQQRYFRYNVDQGLQDVGLEEYRKQALIESATRTYLANELQKRSLRDCAKNLGTKKSSMPMSPSLFLSTDAESSRAAQSASIYFRVPALSSEKLTGREDIMLRLEKLITDSDIHTRVVLYGFGGIGKTRIAREYAYKWKNSITTSVFWVHAGTRERIEKDYLDIAKKVGIPGWQDPKFNQLTMVKDWFERQTLGRWILILDNADDIEMLYGDSSRLADCFPRASNGTILLTTRNKKVGIKFTESDRSLIHVESLTTEDSIHLLKDKISSESGEEDYAQLATTLENVPLALVQAAAYILMGSISISEYLQLYNHSDAAKLQLLDDDFEDSSRDEDTQNAIGLTLIISFEHIRKVDAYAAEVLSIMSMLDPQAIPKSLLSRDENPVRLTKALGTLQAFSLIYKSSRQAQKDEYYDLHRLVRLVMFGYLRRNNEFNISMEKATLIMLERLTRNYNSYTEREAGRTYFPHAAVILSSFKTLHGAISSQVIGLASTAQLEMESDLLFRTSDYLVYTGEYNLGQSMIQRSFAIRDKVLGPEHEKTLDCLSQMMWFLGEERKHKEAIQLGRRMLPRAKKALGPDHPLTLRIMTHLGYNLTEQKMYKEAGKVLQRACQLAQRKFGEENRVTLHVMETWSLNLMYQGKHEEAEQIMRKIIPLRKKVHGEESRNTLTTMSYLAECLSESGKYETAEEMTRSLLRIRTRVFGEEHPDTLLSMSDLAFYMSNQSKHDEAEQMAVHLTNQNKHDEAEQMARRTLSLQTKILGSEHPDTIYTTRVLIRILNEQDKYDEAEQMARQTLQLAKKIWGSEHPDILDITERLKYALDMQGKHEEARTIELQLQDKEFSQKRSHKFRALFSRISGSREDVLSRLSKKKAKD